MSMLYKGIELVEKQCSICDKNIQGEMRENDTAPPSFWWQKHECKEEK
jgi:hypothetical protein